MWLLKKHYADTLTTDLAYFFGRTKPALYGIAKKLGLKKSAEYLKEHCRLQKGSQVGRAHQFKPGHRPCNKGIKGWEAGGDSSKTRFKPGQKPKNWMPIGSHRYSKEGYLQRKMTDTGYPPGDWVAVHILLWVSHHGPVPAYHIVAFKNGDKADILIENLECISRAENMKRNSIHNLPKELADVCRLRGVLNRHINKGLENEKQN